MEKIEFDNLSEIKIPFQDVEAFMTNLEEGLINSDHKDFYRYLNEKEDFNDIFEKYI